MWLCSEEVDSQPHVFKFRVTSCHLGQVHSTLASSRPKTWEWNYLTETERLLILYMYYNLALLSFSCAFPCSAKGPVKVSTSHKKLLNIVVALFD